MASDVFEQTWVPRIGAVAAAQLRRGDMVLAIPPMCAVCGIAYGLLAGFATTFDLVFWCAAVGASVLSFAYWLRGRIAFARSLSAWFGVRVHWFELPRMTPRRFDAWSARRGLRHLEPDPAADGDAATVDEPLAAL